MDIVKNNKALKMENISPLFFVASNPNRAIGLEKEISDYHVICSHKLDILNYLEKAGVKTFCLNDDKIKNTGKILSDRKVLEYIRSESKGKMPNILTFKPSPKIEKICEDSGFRHLGNSWKLNRKFENKVNFVEITKSLNMPNAQSEVIKLERFEDAEPYLKDNAKCVIQLPRGFSGNSTFLVGGREDFEKIRERYAGRRVKIAKYLSGETFTINGCVGKSEIYVGRIIFQITGLTDFNGNQLGTSGNDYVYPEKLSGEAKKKIFDITKKIGEHMKKDGYRGIFGLDFLAGENGAVDLIEINPRLVGSIPVYTKLQLKNRELPFLAIHINSFLEKDGILQETVQSFSSWEKERNFSASQLILRNVAKKPLLVKKNLVSGIYNLENGKLNLLEKTYAAEKELNSTEVLIQCASERSLINPDIEYANIEAGCGIIKEKKLDARFNEIVLAIMREIEFEPK